MDLCDGEALADTQNKTLIQALEGLHNSIKRLETMVRDLKEEKENKQTLSEHSEGSPTFN